MMGLNHVKYVGKWRWIVLLAAAIAAVAVTLAMLGGNASAAHPIGVYSNDFEGAVGSEWSNTSTDTAPADPTQFLGQFGSQTVSLTLTSLPSHSSATVSFELFIIRSWDGHKSGPGPDIWDLSVSGGPTLLNTTFATHEPRRQAYPAAYPGNSGPPHNLPHAGATCANCLGLPNFFGKGDRYTLSFTFPHSGSSLKLDFSGIGLQSLSDESWGLDNVKVSVVNDAPDCSNAGPDVSTLWPPNHEFVPVSITGVTDPDGDPVSINIDGIEQDEPVDAKGSGNTSPDGQGVGSSTAEVRAERSGKGDGRVYHIAYTAGDGQGHSCSGSVTVGVPHDKGQGSTPVDSSPPLYDSTTP